MKNKRITIELVLLQQNKTNKKYHSIQNIKSKVIICYNVKKHIDLNGNKPARPAAFQVE